MKGGKRITREDTATATALSVLKEKCMQSLDYIVVASLSAAATYLFLNQ